MKDLKEFSHSLDFLLTDIDDTLTDHGRLGPEAYQALWDLHRAGIKVIPVTGRPAGWCEMIARQWPVDGVVGENGGFYFRYVGQTMKRVYHFDEATRTKNRQALLDVRDRVLREVPGSAVASDQFCREMDLAIDFCEDVDPLPADAVDRIVQIFTDAGAVAKVSSIHVNGWFGDYDKRSMAFRFLAQEFGLNESTILVTCGFSGDSPNDEPLFKAFPHSFGVANIKRFASALRCPPAYVATNAGGLGFAEIAGRILKSRH